MGGRREETRSIPWMERQRGDQSLILLAKLCLNWTDFILMFFFFFLFRSRCWINISSWRPSRWFTWWISLRKITSGKRTNGELWRFRTLSHNASGFKLSRLSRSKWVVHSFAIRHRIDSRAGSESNTPRIFCVAVCRWTEMQTVLYRDVALQKHRVSRRFGPTLD